MLTAPARAERLGATALGGNRVEFLVWAPNAKRVEVRFPSTDKPVLALQRDDAGYHRGTAETLPVGTRYLFALDGEKERPDPASRFQPEGVHSPSEIVDLSHAWTDEKWAGLPLTSYVIYELHVGAFSAVGTFDGILPNLAALKKLGVTAIELMPIAQFPGGRNWGYDGVYPFAVQNSYGGPQGLMRFVNACHAAGLAVVADVVYNHLGPEGNYLNDFGPYFTKKYNTPWGNGLNFDGAWSDEVRRFFIESAASLIGDFHVDALRVDAVHAIFDQSARPFLADLAAMVRERSATLNRQIFSIAESDLNDTKVVRAAEQGGFGFDAQWNDEFHHALRGALTSDRQGYYEDFGGIEKLAKAYREGYIYSGQYSPHRKRRYGNSSAAVEARQFVVFSQNHDQVGNRMLGERLSQLVYFEKQKLAAAAVLLSPFLPLLFMGEEYGEPAPFLYFISHGDPALVDAVRKGRRDEFRAFNWAGEPPDPQDEATFLKCKLNHALREQGLHAMLWNFYKELLTLRNDVPALRHVSKDSMDVQGVEEDNLLVIRRTFGRSEALVAINFHESKPAALPLVPAGRWQRKLDSSDPAWGGAGAQTPERLIAEGDKRVPIEPLTVVVYTRQPCWQGQRDI